MKAKKVKMKTKSGAAKRFRKVANGYKRNQSHRRHILTKKSPKRKRQLRSSTKIAAADVSSVNSMLREK